MANMMLELRQRRAAAIEKAEALVNAAYTEDRDFTDEEQADYDGLMADAENLRGRIEQMEAVAVAKGALPTPPRSNRAFVDAFAELAPTYGMPYVNKLPRGDSFAQGFAHWAQTGDKSGLDASMFQRVDGMEGLTIQAASNATDMNIGTAADGGNTVPTGFYNQIIARRDEMMLAAKLPLLKVPGVGTTVDVPVDNEADGEFVSTNEAADFDLDAPAIDKKSLTLVKYTKYVDVSYELLDDTGVNLLGFLADFVGRGMAKTHNSLLLTEVAANGTSLKTFASATAVAFGEPEDIVGNDDLANYLDEDSAIAWVMRSSTHWDIKSIVGTDRQYSMNMDNGRTLLGYPVHYSQKAAATAASAKDMYFGNWRYVGWREAPGFTFIRDPYTVAIKGQIRLLWHFRTVYKVLQAEAVGFGVHPSA